MTKYRHKVITSDIFDKFVSIAKERLEAWEGELVEVNFEPDHVHILLELPPKHAVSDFVNALKTSSSRMIRKEYAAHLKPYYWKPVFWSKSFCVVSCSGAPLDIVKQYIKDQKGA
jgi:putative transposase